MSQNLILVEFNELNFEVIQKYVDEGKLPAFKQILKNYGYRETTSEKKLEITEPWIQWATVHNGCFYDEHKLRRLGDAVRDSRPQIWEILEQKGLKVGAISPINARNALKEPSFFVPDPWTLTKTSGSWPLVQLSKAVYSAVNQNASKKVGFKTLVQLLVGFVSHFRFRSLPLYFSCLAKVKLHWKKAVFLDRLLADTFLTQWKKNKPNFSTLFLNGGAHVQHHYLFSSKHYQGHNKNPDWYVPDGEDPVFDMYEMYDEVMNDVMRLAQKNNLRVMIATGLHQVPCKDIVYYYRLREHANFLDELGIAYESVQPLMAEEFVIHARTPGEVAQIKEKVESVRAEADGLQIFSAEERKDHLHVSLIPLPRALRDGEVLTCGDLKVQDFDKKTAFVAIKNGMHSPIGYYVDTNAATETAERVPLTQIFQDINAAFS